MLTSMAGEAAASSGKSKPSSAGQMKDDEPFVGIAKEIKNKSQ